MREERGERRYERREEWREKRGVEREEMRVGVMWTSCQPLMIILMVSIMISANLDYKNKLYEFL